MSNFKNNDTRKFAQQNQAEVATIKYHMTRPISDCDKDLVISVKDIGKVMWELLHRQPRTSRLHS